MFCCSLLVFSLFVKGEVKQMFLPLGEVVVIALGFYATSLQLPGFLNSRVFFIFGDLNAKDDI